MNTEKFCQASIAYCIAWDFWGRSLSASRKPPRLSKRKPLLLPLQINTYLCQPHHKGLRLWGPYLFILNLPTLVAEWVWVPSLVLTHFTCWKTQITKCSQLQATTNCIETIQWKRFFGYFVRFIQSSPVGNDVICNIKLADCTHNRSIRLWQLN